MGACQHGLPILFLRSVSWRQLHSWGGSADDEASADVILSSSCSGSQFMESFHDIKRTSAFMQREGLLELAACLGGRADDEGVC